MFLQGERPGSKYLQAASGAGGARAPSEVGKNTIAYVRYRRFLFELHDSVRFYLIFNYTIAYEVIMITYRLRLITKVQTINN
jgi:hypothetical protein